MYFILRRYYKPSSVRGLYAVVDSKDLSIDYMSILDIKRLIVLKHIERDGVDSLFEDKVYWDELRDLKWLLGFNRRELPDDNVSIDEKIDFIVHSAWEWTDYNSEDDVLSVLFAQDCYNIPFVGGKYSISHDEIVNNYKGTCFNITEFRRALEILVNIKMGGMFIFSGFGIPIGSSHIVLQFSNTSHVHKRGTVFEFWLDTDTLKPVHMVKKSIDVVKQSEKILVDTDVDLNKYIAKLKIAGQL